MRVIGWVLAFSLAVWTTGCATTSGAGALGATMEPGTCPMEIPGTQVAAYETDDGVALEFTNPDAAQAEELRERVHAMPTMVAQRQGKMSAKQRGMPRAQSVTDDLDEGARIVFSPFEPEKLNELRDAIRARAKRMQQGECVAIP